MADNNQMVKYAVAGLSVIGLAAAVWFLSKDSDGDLDKKKFSRDRLEQLMKELQLEITCIYARNYNVMLKIRDQLEKEDKAFGPEDMQALRRLVNNEIKDKQEQVVEDYRFEDGSTLSYGQWETWVEKHIDEDFMTKQRAELEQLDDDLFVRQRIQSLSFIGDIPEDLTAEKYLVMYKKIWSIIRHDMWKEIQAKKKELRATDLPIEEFNKLYNEAHKKFESIRQEVYAMIMGDEQITW